MPTDQFRRDDEMRLQQILDNTTTALVFAKDLDGRYLFVNRAFEHYVNLPRKEILGRTTEEIFPREVAERFRANDRRAIAAGTALETEETAILNGRTRTLLANKFPLVGSDGRPYAVCGITIDISGRKRAEEALRRAALAVSGAGGDKVFEDLVRSLATSLDVQAVLIAVFVDPERSRMRTLATYLDGRSLKSFEYDLARTPCRGVIGRDFRFSPAGINAEFAPGTMFSALGFDSYAAYTLNDASGNQLGLIAAMDRQPMRDREFTEAMLKIYSVRAAAELERARAEEAVRASEEQYRAMFNASVDALVLWNSEIRRVDVNPAYERLFGFTREEVLAGAYPAHQPHEYGERRRALIRRTLAGEPCHVELDAVRKNGERFQVEVRTIPIRHRGEPHVLAITRDITGRKRADEALRASEEQYRAIFNATADALVLRDADFRIVDVNPAYEAMSGHARAEVIGAAHLVANPLDIEGDIRALHARALAGEPFQFECPGVRKDGTRFDVEVRGVPIQHQSRPHVLYIGRDITARKHAEAERARLEAQLRQAQKMEAIGQLTGGIAHDFNNILTSILGYLALAAERDTAREDRKLGHYLEQAMLSSGRARDLIKQMLTFSRGQRSERRPVDLRRVAAEAARMLRSSMPATLELETLPAQEVPLASLNRVQAEQVLLNLCINARDAMQGQGKVRVLVGPAKPRAAVCASCRAQIDGEFVELAVADDGPGIAPEVMERMFEPFFSTKEVGKGSGMGLATVHGIVHEHGGHVVVESVPGSGATFRVLFPVLRADEGAIEHDTLPGYLPTSRNAALRGRVLLVDDEEMVVGFMRELLEGWGLEVTAKTNGTDAREAFARAPERYDLILSDQAMPRVTGLQLARDVHGIRSGVPVILYTGYADELTEAQAEAAGICALLRKPVEPTALLALLKTHLPAGARSTR